jgi:hypothetical protein
MNVDVLVIKSLEEVDLFVIVIDSTVFTSSVNLGEKMISSALLSSGDVEAVTNDEITSLEILNSDTLDVSVNKAVFDISGAVLFTSD